MMMIPPNIRLLLQLLIRPDDRIEYFMSLGIRVGVVSDSGSFLALCAVVLQEAPTSGCGPEKLPSSSIVKADTQTTAWCCDVGGAAPIILIWLVRGWWSFVVPWGSEEDAAAASTPQPRHYL